MLDRCGSLVPQGATMLCKVLQFYFRAKVPKGVFLDHVSCQIPHGTMFDFWCPRAPHWAHVGVWCRSVMCLVKCLKTH